VIAEREVAGSGSNKRTWETRQSPWKFASGGLLLLVEKLPSGSTATVFFSLYRGAENKTKDREEKDEPPLLRVSRRSGGVSDTNITKEEG